MLNTSVSFGLLLLLFLVMTISATRPPRRLPVFSVRGGGRPVQDDDKDNYRSEFIVGKDREIFHASIDLKSVYQSVVDKSLWFGIFRSIRESMKKWNSKYKVESDYQKNALVYAKELKAQRSNSTLRVFSASLLQAQKLARETGRYIVYYCEEDIENAIPSYFTYAFRRALTDPNVEELINEQFIFMTSDILHSYADRVVKLAKSVEMNDSPFDYPLLIILSPKPLPNRPRKKHWWNGIFASKETIDLDVLGMVSLNGQDITGHYLFEFLSTILNVHSNRHNGVNEDDIKLITDISRD